MWPSPPHLPRSSPAQTPAAPTRRSGWPASVRPSSPAPRVRPGRRLPRSRRSDSLGHCLRAFLGVKTLRIHASKSCTARSMAFTKDLWQRISGFPERVFFGEDTLFDLEARRLTKPAFVERAKALYRPQLSFRPAAASWQLRPQRRHPRRSSGAVVPQRRTLHSATPAVLSLPWSLLPLLAILVMQGWFAFHPDWRQLWRYGPRAVLARLLFFRSGSVDRRHQQSARQPDQEEPGQSPEPVKDRDQRSEIRGQRSGSGVWERGG